MSDFPTLTPYLVVYVIFASTAGLIALATLARIFAESRRTAAPRVEIAGVQVPSARTERAGAPVAKAANRRASV